MKAFINFVLFSLLVEMYGKCLQEASDWLVQ